MPNKANAWKALRQSQKRFVRNERVRDGVEYFRRQLKRALDAGDRAKAADAYRAVQQALDRAAEKGVMKDNTVARLKSRAMARLVKMA